VLNLSHLATLVAVIDNGSFGAAARQLGISQPTVSQHVRRLETLLGTRLFRRGGTRAQPTAGARAVLPHARSMLRLNDRLLASIRNDTLVVGASSNIGTYLLQPVIRQWLQSGRRCDMVIRSNPDIAGLLDSGDIDLGLMEWWDNRPGFECSRWAEEELVVAVPPDHPWAGLEQIEPARLTREPLLGGEPGTGTGRLLHSYLSRKGLAPTIGMTFSNTEAVKRAIMHGMGISLLLRSTILDELQAGRLRAIPLADGGLRKSLYAIWRRQPDGAGEPIRSFRELLMLRVSATTAPPHARQ